MGEWKEVRLGDVATITHGFPFDGQWFTDKPTRDVLVTPGNFAIGGGFKVDKLKYYHGPIPDGYVLGMGDLVVTMTDLSKESDTLGYAALVPASNTHRFLHNQRVGKIQITKPHFIDKNYLYWLMRGPAYRAEIIASASGTTVKHTAPSRIERFKFNSPPLPEQRAIANILGSLDDKIELNRKMNETLEAMARALFQSWFVDFDPVRAKALGLQPSGMDVETQKLFPDGFEMSELGEIPRGWRVAALDAIADFRNGLALQRFRPDEGEPRLPVVKIAQLRTGEPDCGEWARADIDPSCILKNGDVVFSWSGSLTVVVWCGGRAALNQHLFRVTSTRFPKWFYLNWLLLHLPEFQRIAGDKATTMGHIQRHHLTVAKCVVPPEPLLRRLSIHFESLLEQRILLDLQSRSLGRIRDALLPRLLSGEIPIKNAERFIASASSHQNQFF